MSVSVEDNLQLVYKVLNDKCKPWTEDDYQNGCVGLIGAAQTFDESKGFKFGTYAYRCILNAIISNRCKLETYAKYNVRRIEEPLIYGDDEGLTLGETIADITNVEEKVLTMISNDEVLKCLNTLTERQKDLVVRNYLLGETQSSIGRSYGCTRVAIASNLKCANKKIKKFYQDISFKTN